MITTKEKMYVTKLLREYEEKLRKEFDLVANIEIDFMYSTKTYGTCSKRVADNKAIIKISEMAIRNGKYLNETIVHELLHAVKGSKGHGKVFQANAKKVNSMFNMHISTYASRSEQESSTKYRVANSKYAVKCTSCQHVYTYQRLTKFIKAVNEDRCGGYVCGLCNAKGNFRIVGR